MRDSSKNQTKFPGKPQHGNSAYTGARRRVRRREEKLSGKLCQMLIDEGLDAEPQSEREGGRQIDIEVLLDGNLKIAVECEKHGPTKQAEAVKDALSRLPHLVDVAVAVVFPEKCDAAEDVTPDIMLEYAIVRRRDKAKFPDYKKCSSSLNWSKCRADGLATILRHIRDDLGEPKEIADDLNARIRDAVGKLSDAQCDGLAKVITLAQTADKKRAKTNAAKRALVVVASAALFHARLADHLNYMPRPDGHSGEWPPRRLDGCRDRHDLLESWRLILMHDYKPIFQTGITVLECSTGPQFADAIEGVMGWARRAADQPVSRRHDLLGEIFHAVLDTAKQDGSFYTSAPAAKLLADLAIRGRSDVPENPKDMRVIDPACGTGTLLMATAERLKAILGDEYDPNVLVEDILNGIDINITATHMAATTVGMMSPDTKFDKMQIYHTHLGMKGGRGCAGSLELYQPDGLLPYMDWYGGPDKQVDSGKAARRAWKRSADLVIMNPPYTRNDLRHDQLGPEAEQAVKLREAEIFAKAPVSLTSSGILFLLLGERLAKDSGAVAFVFPMAGTTALSNAGTRRFLAERFQVDTILAPHDPERFWFSDSTRIAEMLVILRRGPPRDTKIINLAVNPDTVSGAAALADSINRGNPENCRVVWWPRSKVERGDWSGVQFYSPYLVERFADMRDGKLFKSAKLGDVADTVGSPRDVRAAFEASNEPDKHARFVRYDHKTDEVVSMRAAPNKYLVVKCCKEKQAERAWAKAGLLHVPERLQPNITHVAAIATDGASIGTSWYAITPKRGDPAMWSKAMAVCLNSTVGVVAMLGVRIPFKPLYPRYGVTNIRSLPVPVLSRDMVKRLAAAYDKHCDSKLGLWGSPNKTRMALDDVVRRVLGLDESTIGTMRRELSREPMVTGKRYGAQPGMDDYLK